MPKTVEIEAVLEKRVATLAGQTTAKEEELKKLKGELDRYQRALELLKGTQKRGRKAKAEDEKL